MLLASERSAVAQYAQRLVPDRLVVGTAGNISVRAGDLLAITPSGCPYDRLTPELIAVVDMSGRVHDGTLAPSSELPMHLAVYGMSDARAIVHTHSRFATVLSTHLQEVPAIHYSLAQLGPRVPVAPYATFGTPELAASIAAVLGTSNAALVQNHGALTLGPSLESAYDRAQLLEWLCEVYYRAALLGSPRILSDAEMAAARERFALLGRQRDGGLHALLGRPATPDAP